MGKQVRSENTYQKINTIFKRDKNNVIMPYSGLVSEELEWLRGCKFDAEEKIDGTNTRIEVTSCITYATKHVDDYETENDFDWPLYVEWNVSFKGKTDGAQIPPALEKWMKETFTREKVLSALGLAPRMYLSDYMIDKTEHAHWLKTAHNDAYTHKWVALDQDGNPTTELDLSRMPRKYTLYGEGYGEKIQSGGYYRKGVSFIGFDVKVDDLYLLRAQRDEIFNKLGCDIVPYIGQFTIDEAIEYVKKGFPSKISREPHLAEGLVLRSPVGIKGRRGDRIMFKVKTCDWSKYYNKYKTYDPVPQEEKTV